MPHSLPPTASRRSCRLVPRHLAAEANFIIAATRKLARKSPFREAYLGCRTCPSSKCTHCQPTLTGKLFVYSVILNSVPEQGEHADCHLRRPGSFSSLLHVSSSLSPGGSFVALCTPNHTECTHRRSISHAYAQLRSERRLIPSDASPASL